MAFCYSQLSFHHRDVSQRLLIGKCKLYHNVPAAAVAAADDVRQTKPFSLIFPRSINPVCKGIAVESVKKPSPPFEILGSGVVLMRNYISLRDQVEIVNICHKLGVGPGGFCQPGYRDGSKLRLQRMCFGRNWDPDTKYRKLYCNDGSKPPPVPQEFVSLVQSLIQDAQTLLKSDTEIPLMCPDVCLVNFYTSTGRLGLHQDRDESPNSIRRGLPVVSISIGDSAEFLYGYTRDEDKLREVVLESGDVLIFVASLDFFFMG